LIVELKNKKCCRSPIADLKNLTSAIPQLSAISGQFPYFIVLFPQLRMLYKKIQPKTMFTIVCFNGNQKLALKGQ
jgi:hypothetical protein